MKYKRFKASYSHDLMGRLITLYFDTLDEITNYQKKHDLILWWVFDTTKRGRQCIYENGIFKICDAVKK